MCVDFGLPLPPLPRTTDNSEQKDSNLRLVSVRLGRAATKDAFQTLATCNPHTTTLADVKSAFLYLVVTFGEGMNTVCGVTAYKPCLDGLRNL